MPGNVNAGIRDRFYGAASATPTSVFPRLLRTYQHHLSKLTPQGPTRAIDPRDSRIDPGLSASIEFETAGYVCHRLLSPAQSFFTKKQEPVSEPLTTAES